MQARAVHRCIHVLDLEKSLAFYEQALGMKVVRRMGPDDGSWENVFVANDDSGFQVELTWNRGRTEPYVNGGRDTHLAFAVDNMDEARALHERMGCVCFVNERMGIYFIEDPDGCWIEIVPLDRAGNAAQAGADVLAAMRNRRSVRSYAGERIPNEKIERVIEAGLLSAAGRGIRPWELVVVRDRSMLESLASCRTAGAQMLTEADAAIVVVANVAAADTWVEDCSIVMANMHLAADALGLGSCWIQGRGREAADGRSTRDYVAASLDIPDGYEIEAILSLGVCAEHPEPRVVDEMLAAKVHRDSF
ncbi:nitroreductase family protein [Adlercreutzia sp. ZJ138]|uniref:nitroreductase family protein n=1 Tax=Adlercreutzia sp. ZJ138 TaxID=2709405 RepID=UPI00197EEDF9|nr:nitroreductase family protein [Adlercreutzia sp. ZJ138]